MHWKLCGFFFLTQWLKVSDLIVIVYLIGLGDAVKNTITIKFFILDNIDN